MTDLVLSVVCNACHLVFQVLSGGRGDCPRCGSLNTEEKR